VVFDHAFHGRTQLGMTMTAKPMPYKAGLGPASPEIYRMPFPYGYRCALGPQPDADCAVHCADYLEDAIHTTIGDDRVAAVVVEPVQGEGGFNVAPPVFLQRLREICDRYGICWSPTRCSRLRPHVQDVRGRPRGRRTGHHDDGEVAGRRLPARCCDRTGRADGCGARRRPRRHVRRQPGRVAAALAVVDMLENGGLLDDAARLGEQLEAGLDALAESTRSSASTAGSARCARSSW
jgi:4-aminobutyrate aminotransferase-like enzyme